MRGNHDRRLGGYVLASFIPAARDAHVRGAHRPGSVCQGALEVRGATGLYALMLGSRTWTDADGSRLKRLREALGWDLPALARRCALSVTQVRQLEEGGESAFYSAEIKFAAGQRVLARLVAAGGPVASGDNPHQEV